MFVWGFFRNRKTNSDLSTQTEPGVWLPVISMDFEDPIYDSSEDVEMTPVDSHDIMTYRDYCS